MDWVSWKIPLQLGYLWFRVCAMFVSYHGALLFVLLTWNLQGSCVSFWFGAFWILQGGCFVMFFLLILLGLVESASCVVNCFGQLRSVFRSNVLLCWSQFAGWMYWAFYCHDKCRVQNKFWGFLLYIIRAAWTVRKCRLTYECVLWNMLLNAW